MSLPALLGGAPVAGADTYPSWPQWGEREREELLATLDSGAWWTGDGDRAFRFAGEFARFQGAAGGLTAVENLLIGSKLSEFHTGYRAFSRRVLETLPLEENAEGFVFDNQMLVQAVHFGLGEPPLSHGSVNLGQERRELLTREPPRGR